MTNYFLYQVNRLYSTNALYISVSVVCLGLSKGVGVYRMDLLSKLDLVFTHFGHEAEMADSSVLTHSWHPKIPKLLVSTSSDGSLHAWQWKDQIT